RLFQWCIFYEFLVTCFFTLSLHDALPIWRDAHRVRHVLNSRSGHPGAAWCPSMEHAGGAVGHPGPSGSREHVDTEEHTGGGDKRSEEHTSELQSRFDLVCRLLLEKKKVQY